MYAAQPQAPTAADSQRGGWFTKSAAKWGRKGETPIQVSTDAECFVTGQTHVSFVLRLWHRHSYPQKDSTADM